MPLDLTIVLPVKNEERNLPGCLEAIGEDLAAAIVVIDSGSTDRTREIALQYGATVIQFDWDGKFPKKRNWYLRNHPPATRWVMFLDADEYLLPGFRSELKRVLPATEAVGFWLRYTIYFLGKPLKGGYPLRKLALFRVGAGEYERIDEDAWSHLDMEIHEHPILQGRIEEIREPIDHRDFRGVSHWVNKHNEYSSWEARRYQKLMEDPGARARWTFFQRIKYALMNTPLIGPAFFLGSFLLMGGFRDGSRGFAWALLKAGYFNQVYCKIRESATGA
jgi:glycosyltransferase involved in cell wall biosynthesis